MKHLPAALALSLLAGCVQDIAGAVGANRTSPWYETGDVLKSRDELTKMVRELIDRCGYKVPESQENGDYFVTEWDTRMSPHWRESFRSKLEIEIVSSGNGQFNVHTRSWMEVNNNMVAPSDPNKAEWVGAGVTDRHKDRINEPALRFHNMLKFRLFGLNQ
jgi:hypothetical protein